MSPLEDSHVPCGTVTSGLPVAWNERIGCAGLKINRRPWRYIRSSPLTFSLFTVAFGRRITMFHSSIESTSVERCLLLFGVTNSRIVCLKLWATMCAIAIAPVREFKLEAALSCLSWVLPSSAHCLQGKLQKCLVTVEIRCIKGTVYRLLNIFWMYVASNEILSSWLRYQKRTLVNN